MVLEKRLVRGPFKGVSSHAREMFQKRVAPLGQDLVDRMLENVAKVGTVSSISFRNGYWHLHCMGTYKGIDFIAVVSNGTVITILLENREPAWRGKRKAGTPSRDKVMKERRKGS